MRNKYLLLIFILLISFSACRQNDTKKSEYTYYNEFPSQTNLIGETLDLNNDSLFFNTLNKMIGYKNFIFVLDTEDLTTKDKCVLKFSYPDLKYICSYGTLGKSQEEYISVSDIDVNNDELSILDEKSNRRLVYDINSNTNKVKRVEKIGESEKSSFEDFTIIIEDSILVHCSINNQVLAYIKKRNGEFLDSIMLKEKVKEEINSNKAFITVNKFSAKFSYSEKNRIIAAATANAEIIALYDLNKKSSKIIVGPGGFPEVKISIQPILSIVYDIMGFSKIKIYDDKIYALFDGRKNIDIFQLESLSANNIYVYDMDGTPLHKYILDKPVCDFHVDTERKTITGLVSDTEEPFIQFNI